MFNKGVWLVPYNSNQFNPAKCGSRGHILFFPVFTYSWPSRITHSVLIIHLRLIVQPTPLSIQLDQLMVEVDGGSAVKTTNKMESMVQSSIQVNRSSPAAVT